MYIKIYFNDKPLFLCDELTPEIRMYAHHDDAVLIDEFSAPAVNSMIHEMKLGKIHAGIFVHQNFNELQKAFWKKFLIVKAAGGLVFNKDQDLLFIFRKGKWDLPKGKLDPGETLQDCAVREVIEETGLESIQVNKEITTTYHTYEEGGKPVLKESYWFEMHVKGVPLLIPQTAEEIQEARWVRQNNLEELLKNTYPSIKDVLKIYVKEIR